MLFMCGPNLLCAVFVMHPGKVHIRLLPSLIAMYVTHLYALYAEGEREEGRERGGGGVREEREKEEARTCSTSCTLFHSR